MKRNTVLTIASFILLFGGTAVTQSSILTLDRYPHIAVFLIVVIALLAATNKQLLSKLITTTNPDRILFLLGFSVLVHALTTYSIVHYATQPIWPVDSHGTSFLLMNKYFIFVKPIDVLLQQLLIVLLVLKLKSQGLTVRAITVALFLGFGLLHIFQIFKATPAMGLAYTVFASAYALFFPYMILRIKNGFIYNYIIHLAVYDIAALIAWFLF